MMTQIRPRRSALYMPGSNARVLEKARSIDADCLIFDLEDAVAPDAKVGARQQIADAVAAGGYDGREVVVRVNGLDTEWGADDVLAMAKLNIDAILVPKISDAQQMGDAAQAISDASGDEPPHLWIMVETAFSILNIQSIAASAHRLSVPLDVFVLGTNDLAKETRAELTPERTAFVAWISQCVIAARAYGIDVLDGVFNAFKDSDGFLVEARQGLVLGCDGKTLIHPAQVAPANEIFGPNAEDVSWAKTVLAAFDEPENQGKGVITIDGQMVELLHAEMAERTVRIAEAVSLKDGGS